jgi:isoamylase
MISGGDELGRSQLGNNNAYCHDTELTWTPWLAEDGADLALLVFVQQLAAWRRATPALQRTTFFDADGTDALWLRPDGTPMTEADWHDPEARGLVLRLLPELKLRPPHEQIDIAFD